MELLRVTITRDVDILTLTFQEVLSMDSNFASQKLLRYLGLGPPSRIDAPFYENLDPLLITESNVNPSTQVRFLYLKEITIPVILMSSFCKDTHVASLFSCF